jgi:transcriptional regulator GlxA family with amidase domain
MKHIAMLVPAGDVSLTNIEGVYKVFTYANELRQSQGKPPLFQIHLVGSSPEVRLNHGLFTLKPDVTTETTMKADLIIIPAVQGKARDVVALNQDLIPWITRHYKMGAEIASLCIGAFLLASTGLLRGKKCATHWTSAEEFRRMFPDIDLVTDKIITDEHGIYSSGGAYSFLNLLLYLVEKYAGHELAVRCAKEFEIDIERDSQSPFIIFNSQKVHDDDVVRRAQEFIEQNFQDKITVTRLATMLAVSRRNLERRFKRATSNSVVEYLQRVKIEAAKISFESSRENVNEVMYKVGYMDTKAFRVTFKKITGLSPVEYRNRYNRQIAERVGH